MPLHVQMMLRKVRCVTLDVDGVLTDGNIIFSSDGTEYKSFNAQDGFGIKMLQARGIPVAIISGRKSEVVEQRARELHIRHVYQGVEDKLQALHHFLDNVGCEPNEVVHVGDDEPDAKLFGVVGVAVAVANAVPRVKAAADIVTQRSGGCGAVREFCEWLLAAHADSAE